MGLEKLGESWAAKRMPRFAPFREGRALYEDYCQERLTLAEKEFSDLLELDFTQAASDPRLKQAESLYQEALKLCRQESAYHDIAVACYQLGLLSHLQGRFRESEAFCTEALEISESLPRLSDADVQLISGCCYHLGILAARNRRTDLAKLFLERSLRLDESLPDPGGVHLTRKALARFVEESSFDGEDPPGAS